MTATSSVEEWAAEWQALFPGISPAELGVVVVGDFMRSAAAGSAVSTTRRGSVSISAVPSTADLPDTGRAIAGYLDAWRDDDARIAVCFHALPALLDHADRVRVLRFLAGVQERVADAGAVAHYHVDPAACDRHTLERLEALFPAVIEV